MLSFLIALLRPGHDVVSFETAYRQHFAFTWRALRRLGVPERDLPDATQDVFLVVYRKLGEFDYQCRLTTWLYAICFRVASERRRRPSARREILSDSGDSDVRDALQAPVANDADGSRLADYRALLREALDEMPAEQRAVFVAFELQGLEGDEVAAAMSIPVATAHSRLRLARGTFRRVLLRAESRERFDALRLGAGS